MAFHAHQASHAHEVSPRSLSYPQVAQRLRRLVDAALLGVILIAPLFMGGRGPVGKLVLVSLICVSAIGWFAEQAFTGQHRWRWCGAEWLLALGVSLVVLQLLPLPANLLDKISPAISQLLPVWRADAPQSIQLGDWSTLSLTPQETRNGLILLIAYAMLFIVLIQRLNSVDDIERLVKWLAIAALGMASLGMLQLLAGNGNFLWIYNHPSRDTYSKTIGTFQNQNHFAHFLALGIGPLIWWIQRKNAGKATKGKFTATPGNEPTWYERAAQHLLPVGLGLVLVASLLTYSRGGVLSVALAASLTVVIYFAKSLFGRKSLWAVGGFAAIVCVALAIYGHDRLSMKLGTLTSGSLNQISESRLDLWRAQWEAIPRFPLVGAGVGSHREVYPIFMEEHYDLEFAYGENGYFQILVEVGLAGLALLLTGFAMAIRYCVAPLMKTGTSSRLVALAGSLLPGIVVSLFHSWGDFVWYIPACMTFTVFLAACACRVYQIGQVERSSKSDATTSGTASSRTNAKRTRSDVPIPVWLAAAMTVLLLASGTAALRCLVQPAMAASAWDAYQRLALAEDGNSAVSVLQERERLGAMEEQLTRVVSRYPKHARAQLRLAASKLRRFELEQQSGENPMGLSQIRDAALASAFPSKSAQDEWLSVAVGENRRLLEQALHHCRAALNLSPLQGAGYVFLAELAFLEDPRETAKQELIRQAVRVRPHSGYTLFAMGKECVLAGDLEQAIEYWRRAFRQDPEVQVLIIEAIANYLPCDLFVQSFEPDLDGMRRLFSHYRQSGSEPNARFVAEKFVTSLQNEATTATPERAARIWHESQGVLAWLGQLEQAVQCQRQAVALAPQDFEMRKTLGLLLLQTQEYEEGVQQLEWCTRRHPEDLELKRQLADARIRRSQAGRIADSEMNPSPRRR